MVTPREILGRLPVYKDEWELVTSKQYVPDIINEICTAHRLYGRYYDNFSDLFYDTHIEFVADHLYDFCKQYINYKEEGVEFQTSALPTGIVERGYGDCKHYALFCAGVIASLNRIYGTCYDAHFYFVGYKKAKEPYHVYVSVKEYDQEIWIDPTPGSGGMPTLLISKPV